MIIFLFFNTNSSIFFLSIFSFSIMSNFLFGVQSKNTLEEMQRFFRTKNDKKLVIKALEYVMHREEFTYLEVYRPDHVIKYIKGRKKYGVYRFINQL